MYKLEDSKTPLYVQLYEQIKEEIINNTLKANSKLPSIRLMASDYKISKNTVQTAYNQLYAEGYIDSQEKKGFFVCEDLYKNIVEKKTFLNNQKESKIIYKYDFYPVRLINKEFPKKQWLKTYNKVLKEQKINFGEYQNSQGIQELRDELKNYLLSSRGVNCTSEQIVICSGFSDAMFIVSTLLKNHTKTIALEENTYRVAKKVFSQNGFNLEEISTLNYGINIKELNQSKAKLLYVTPAHQYLKGFTTPISKRIKLLEWAKKTNSYIIEDDYDSELSYYNKPIPALQGINNNDNTIFFGSLSKAFSPSLRIAYLILPNNLLKDYKKAFDYSFSGVSIDIQKTLANFIKEGDFIKHIRKIRTLNKKRHNILKEELIKSLKNDIQIIREGSGLSILIKPLINIDLLYLQQKANEEKINICIRYDDYLAMGFGGFEDNEIPKAVEAFVKVWKKVKVIN